MCIRDSIKAIATATDGSVKRMAITYDVVNDEGKVISSNAKLNRVVCVTGVGDVAAPIHAPRLARDATTSATHADSLRLSLIHISNSYVSAISFINHLNTDTWPYMHSMYPCQHLLRP